jgi:flagellar biosynthesis/type III secretory pathway chaperone
VSAFLLISIIWFSVGYLMSTRYFVSEDNDYIGFLSGLMAVIIVVNIERTIVLGTRVSSMVKLLRVILAFIIALIGATVIDQIIFEDDVLNYKKNNLYDFVEKRTAGQKKAIVVNLNNLVQTKAELNRQLQNLEQEIINRPTVIGSVSNKTPKTTEGETSQATINSSVQRIANPAIQTANEIRSKIAEYLPRIGQVTEESGRLVANAENEYLSNRAFLHELEILIKVLSQNTVALVVYILWMTLLLIIELLVLVIKTGDAENDYDLLIQHQVDVKKRRIEGLK